MASVRTTPRVGDIVHYVSYGTPGGEYSKECRAAIVTEVGEEWVPEGQEPITTGTPVSLAVLNPTGMFFNRGVIYDDGAGHPGAADCPQPQIHGNPFRYCACGWTEPALRGGTWHQPDHDLPSYPAESDSHGAPSDVAQIAAVIGH